MTQKTPADLRAAAENELREPGQRYLRKLAELEVIRAELRPLIVNAVANEVPFRRIAELTTITPNTARAWHRRASTR